MGDIVEVLPVGLLGKTLQSQHSPQAAAAHLQDAATLLAEITKEARTEENLKRSDLAPVRAEVAAAK